jgi:four helix bundle protein
MENRETKIRSFTDLIVWKKGHGLVLLIYKLSSAFPKEEIFGLNAQIRRAVVSVTSNIAEGFCRNSSKDKLHFYNISLSSLVEVQNQMLIARDLKYISKDLFKSAANHSIEVAKLLNGLIKKIKIANY